MSNINTESYFDQIYCINLKARSDRLLAFKKNYEALGTCKINFFEAIDGRQIDLGNWKYNSGALGCRLSHLAVFKHAMTHGYSKILVFEDDAIVNKRFKKKLAHLLDVVNDNWDMIYFGGNHYLKPDRINKQIIKLNNTLTTHAIAYNCRCLPIVIKKIVSDERWIDSVIADLHVKLKVYGFVKPVVTQMKGYSDIEEKFVNYSTSSSAKVLLLLNKMKRKFYVSLGLSGK